ncbi:uncharacterized protein LOC135463092 [Liolophura sinensis]|uniref:uncharacterized protein LOC135463092 n=1 Tax=Liolophura sinensis TaxID=3198878 RepID=UPI003158FE42
MTGGVILVVLVFVGIFCARKRKRRRKTDGATFGKDLRTDTGRVDAVNLSLPEDEGDDSAITQSGSQRLSSDVVRPTGTTYENGEVTAHALLNSDADISVIYTNTTEEALPRFPQPDVHRELYSNHHIPANKEKQKGKTLAQSCENQGGSSTYDILCRPNVNAATDYSVQPDDYKTLSTQNVKLSTNELVQPDDYNTLYEVN